jgi:hypothetical protein
VTETPANRRPDLLTILDVLNRHQVDYVVIGGFAALVHDARIPPTQDVDVAPSARLENLDRLSEALRELGARIRTAAAPDGLPFEHSGTSLSGVVIWNLVCAYGNFDITFQPGGFPEGYAELITRAHRVRIAATEVTVADLADVIRSKEAAGRPKDLRALPALYERLAEIEHRRS